MTEHEMLIFLKARPTLKRAIETDVVACGGPSGEVTCANSLVFDVDGRACHYAVCIDGDDVEYGSSIECTEEDCDAALACELDKKSQGFE